MRILRRAEERASRAQNKARAILNTVIIITHMKTGRLGMGPWMRVEVILRRAARRTAARTTTSPQASHPMDPKDHLRSYLRDHLRDRTVITTVSIVKGLKTKATIINRIKRAVPKGTLRSKSRRSKPTPEVTQRRFNKMQETTLWTSTPRTSHKMLKQVQAGSR